MASLLTMATLYYVLTLYVIVKIIFKREPHSLFLHFTPADTLHFYLSSLSFSFFCSVNGGSI